MKQKAVNIASNIRIVEFGLLTPTVGLYTSEILFLIVSLELL